MIRLPATLPVLLLLLAGSCRPLAALPEPQTGEEDLLAGDRRQEGEDRRPYLQEDPTGARRPRLFGEGLFGGMEFGGARIELGGYFDLEYRAVEGKDRRFRFHRLVPLIEGRVSERIRFQTEIEIEDGGEVEVEFAHLDYRFHDLASLRGGVILMPLGRLNLIHDSPIQELTDRPLVSGKVIPTTLRDAGFGIFGKTLAGPGSLSWEVYATTGFRGQDGSGGYLLDRTGGLRSGRSAGTVRDGSGSTLLSPYEDNNNGLALSGRLGFKGAGYEAGLSGYHGAWDDAGNLDLDMAVLDLDLSPMALPSLAETVLGDMNFLFEGALGRLDRDAPAVSGGVPGEVGGWYAQWNWRLPTPAFLQEGEDPLIEEGGGLTLVFRMGRVDLHGARFERSVLGITLRPNADRTVFKFEYQWNSEGGLASEKRDNAFVASIATYF